MNGKSRFMLVILGVFTASNALVVLSGKSASARQNVWEQTELPARWRSRVSNLLGDGRRQEAILMLRNYLRSAPGDVNVRRLLGKVLFESGRYDEARDVYYAVLMNDPGDFVARNNMGVVLAKQGLWDDARRELEEAFNASAQESFIAANLGCCHELAGNRAEAANVWKSVREVTSEGDGVMAPDDAFMLEDAGKIGRLRQIISEKNSGRESAKAREQ
jgi:Flp pilus assembly protein TadD